MLSAHTDSDFCGIGNPKVSQLFGLVVLLAPACVFGRCLTPQRGVFGQAVIIRLIEINVFEMFAPELFFGGTLYRDVQNFVCYNTPDGFSPPVSP